MQALTVDSGGGRGHTEGMGSCCTAAECQLHSEGRGRRFWESCERWLAANGGLREEETVRSDRLETKAWVGVEVSVSLGGRGAVCGTRDQATRRAFTACPVLAMQRNKGARPLVPSRPVLNLPPEH